MTKDWQITVDEIFKKSPVMPVIVIHRLEDAVPIAKALVKGGIPVLEVTLRTDVAIDAIRLISEQVPEAFVGAGTVTNETQLKQVIEAGAKFAISPGMTRELLQAGNDSPIALIPGISSTSDLMKGLEYGYDRFKFFPAEASGGAKAIKSIGGPFPDIVFCPTGGIGPDNCMEYLSLKNVACVGGSWLVPDEAVKNQQWQQLTDLAAEAVKLSQAA